MGLQAAIEIDQEDVMGDKAYWEKIYSTKALDQVSWYQVRPDISLDLIQSTGVSKTAQIIDVGAGASTLVDYLLEDGFQHISVLDISSTALARAKTRLGMRADQVTWIEADITEVTLPPAQYDVWHDRAVFHFLTDAEERQSYVATVRRSLKPGGHIIVASFALDGPQQCSGLNVVDYSPENLHGEFGNDFDLVESRQESHQTPFNTQQNFIYCYCRKR